MREANQMCTGRTAGEAALAIALLVGSVLSAGGGCTTYENRVSNPGGVPRTYEAFEEQSRFLGGTGIESQDIAMVTEQMAREMLSVRALAGRAKPPRVIIDSRYFNNQSSNILDLDSLTEDLLYHLSRASQGRMTFVGRQYAGMVENERALKREGVADPGSLPMTQAVLGADYRLAGKITSLDARDARSGVSSRATQIFFTMVDLETSEIIWQGRYRFKKTAQDDVIYR